MLPSRLMKVGVEDFRGKYRVRLPRQVADGSKRYISTGLPVGDANHRRVQMLCLTIEDDLLSSNFDTTLARYQIKPSLQLARVDGKPLGSAKLIDLWDSFSEYKRPQLAETTYRIEYCRKFRNHILGLPTQDLGAAIAIRDHLLATVSVGQTKKIIEYLSACCDWAVDSGKVSHNPFAKMQAKIRVQKVKRDLDLDVFDIDPFSRLEREAIREGFLAYKPYWYPWVEFLLLTGARPGEAAALNWGNVQLQRGILRITQSYEGSLKLLKDTKTGEPRTFPINSQLGSLLEDIKAKAISAEATALVFTAPSGGYVNTSKFTNQIWKGCKGPGTKKYLGVIPRLMESGQVDRYRPPYNCRHTFISMAIEEGLTHQQVAKLVGNSAEVIVRHYAGSTRPVAVPEF